MFDAVRSGGAGGPPGAPIAMPTDAKRGADEVEVGVVRLFHLLFVLS
jgi:hypothetical protein